MKTRSVDRRAALRTAACGFGSVALAGLCNRQSQAGNPLATKVPQFVAKAKRVIFLFMQGGPSQVDSFDPKPQLKTYDGKKVEFNVARTRKRTAEPVMDALWKFKRHGECGQPVSELFPHIAQHVDDLCFLHGMHTEGVAHGPSTLFLHTGATNLIRPSVGAWVTYGLGTENENLPGFVTINPSPTKGGPRNYSNAFLPSAYQGTAIGRPGMPVSDAKIAYIANHRMTRSQQREHLNALQELNREQLSRHTSAAGLDNVIESFELAYRMQSEIPSVMDFSGESKSTLDAYGIGMKATDNFGRQCLLARRLAESGVRFVQLNYSDNSATPKWDQHSNMPAHADHAFATDQPVAALLGDLKQRGLLDDTLVWWGGEFGRTPFAQNRNGRDHNPKGFTVFLAGGGVKKGIRYGATDEWGYEAVADKVHMHDLHATLLHLMGIDHTELTYRFAGRDFRLTDIHGSVVHDIIA